ncbi:GNAT family N-acetyltransferase [Actinotalea sp. K2]|uniref:GNAT family N-acetyltransferase n=1 Tax=Actinotalea sp. K2 TaxID=2939438 RepID=UPI0020175B12|nr:GNAT family N-acetyltransferase [Actinotalea sp. K2]MCL3860486.1 GNAT family N-acetyltransferase [Actinotalea sp. K2]
MTLEIRRARPEDLDRVGDLTAHAYLADDLISPGHEYLDELHDAAGRAGAAVVLVAVEGERLLGTITLTAYGSTYAEVARPDELELRMLAVDPAARGRGVGEALTRAAVHEGRATSALRVVLSTMTTMRAAQRMYERIGFDRAPDLDWTVGEHEMLGYSIELRSGPGAPSVDDEVATWPPLEVAEVGGWRVGISGGFTRRGNSVVASAEPRDVDQALTVVEALYRARGLPAVYRVCPATRPVDLDRSLARRGYALVAPTRVLGVGVDEVLDRGPASGLAPRLEVADRPDDRWLRTWLAVKTGPGPVPAQARRPSDQLDLARRLLGGAPGVYLGAWVDADLVGVARVARAGRWAGLACMTVVPHARRRGVARWLSLAAFDAARELGADRVFLQVEESNTAARSLYASLGLVEVSRYHYRERPMAGEHRTDAPDGPPGPEAHRT